MRGHFQGWSWNLLFNWGDLEGSSSVSEQGDGDAWIEIETALHALLILHTFSLKLPAVVYVTDFLLLLLFFLIFVWFSPILYQIYVCGRSNSFLGVEPGYGKRRKGAWWPGAATLTNWKAALILSVMFINYHIQQICTEYLPYARHSSRYWGDSSH